MTGTYQKNATRKDPGCILFLLDHSLSMNEAMGANPLGLAKCDLLAEKINQILFELISKCTKGYGPPNDYFEVGMLGYTTVEEGRRNQIESIFLTGPLAGKALVLLSELYHNPVRSGEGDMVWCEPTAVEGTPMCAALEHCHTILADWCQRHPHSFPPVLLHITDGESQDGDPESVAARLRELGTEDGKLLLFNCHLSGEANAPVVFPLSEDQVGDEYGKMLFRMSSVIPDPLRFKVKDLGMELPPGCRGMVYNDGDGKELLKILQIGTAVAPKRGGALR